MRTVTIAWCGNPETTLGRVVLDPMLDEAGKIRKLAAQLELPVIEGQTVLQENDLWVGISPEDGWGDLAGETMWARSAEAELVIGRLEQAKVTST